jgi:diguanylate cyclase (GGDEF)-like protein
MKRKNIAIFAKNTSVLSFLERFFLKKKRYHPQYFTSLNTLDDALHGTRPSCILTEDSLLSSLSGSRADIPVIAFVVARRRAGIRNAVRHGANHYLSRPYVEEDLEHQISSVVSAKETHDSLKQEIEDLKVITDLTELISSTLDPKELLYRIVKKISAIMPVTRCSIIQIDWRHKYARVIASHELPRIKTIRLSLKKYPEILEALSLKRAVLIRNAGTDPVMRPVRDIVAPLGIKSILVLPIVFEEQVIGTLFLRTSRVKHAFSDREIKLLHTIARASANTLHNAFLFSRVEDEKTRLENLAITDFLTGIYNVRYFYHHVIEEFHRSERYSLPISCLMLDIDYFKRINDTYGHKIGDLVLREFAQLLKNHSRKSDILARYGGEEFIIMLPQTSLQGAVAEAERMRNVVKVHMFKSLRNKVGITVSIGISSFPHPRIKTHDELISSADDALYEAKNSGRDRYSIFP